MDNFTQPNYLPTLPTVEMPLNSDLTADFNKRVDICLKFSAHYVFVDTNIPKHLNKNLAELIKVYRSDLGIRAETNELIVLTNGIRVDLFSLPAPGQQYYIAVLAPCLG